MKKKIPQDLDVIAKTVLAYRPPEKDKAAKKREKRRARRAAQKK